MTEPCRFPPPWTLDDNGNCFIIKDGSGQALAYVYYEHEGQANRRHFADPQ